MSNPRIVKWLGNHRVPQSVLKRARRIGRWFISGISIRYSLRFTIICQNLLISVPVTVRTKTNLEWNYTIQTKQIGNMKKYESESMYVTVGRIDPLSCGTQSTDTSDWDGNHIPASESGTESLAKEIYYHTEVHEGKRTDFVPLSYDDLSSSIHYTRWLKIESFREGLTK